MILKSDCMMSKDKVTTSPTRFNGELDHFFDPNFTEEISQKMQVPKRIKVNGESEDDVIVGVGGHHHATPAWENEKFDMHVPDRILVVDYNNRRDPNSPEPDFTPSKKPGKVSHSHLHRVTSNDTIVSVNSNWHLTPSINVSIPRIDGPLSRPSTSLSARSRTPRKNQSGQDQLMGTRGTPLEVNHENTVIPTDPGMIRVQTPPRVITLTDHYFPSADDLPPITDETVPPPVLVRSTRAHSTIDSDGDHRNELHHIRKSRFREATPSLTEGMSTNEEIAHLRRQLAKLNRRVMSIELENLQRQQYEKIVYVVGIAYAIWKTLLWLRSS
ncbi:transport and golgi organization 11 isoform X2 [Lycorma delicatula]|uniref:transport and golgi organization 11 isoform X2 n=1 Tax=Lycorma delicatula TaxID=130591 RepID=UPI003F51A7D4